MNMGVFLNEKPKVGDKLFLIELPSIETKEIVVGKDVLVTSVGNKYFCINSTIANQWIIKGKLPTQSYFKFGMSFALFPSKQNYESYLTAKRLLEKIEDFTVSNKHSGRELLTKVSVSELKQACSLLGLNIEDD